MFNALWGAKWSATGAPVPKPESLLSKAAKTAVPKLLQVDTGKARSAGLRSLGKQILQMGRFWPKVDWRQFALMHNASIITETTFEGGFIGVNIQAWLTLLNLWKKGEGKFFSVDLSDKQVEALTCLLEDFEYIRTRLPPLSLDPLGQSDVEKYASQLQKAIASRLHQKKVLYLPLGYRHGIGNEGHAIPCKLELNSDASITISLLNLGAGSGEHPVLNYTTSQEKVSIRSYPIKVEKDVFWGEMGFTALCHMVRYMSDPAHVDQSHYVGEDVYDVFKTLGKVIPQFACPHPEYLKAKSQRYPSCTEKGVKNVVHDGAIDLDIGPKVSKKLFLNVYFCSLIAGYHSYLGDPSEIRRTLLKNGAEEMGVTLEKLKGEITKKDTLRRPRSLWK